MPRGQINLMICEKCNNCNKPKLRASTTGRYYPDIKTGNIYCNCSKEGEEKE